MQGFYGIRILWHEGEGLARNFFPFLRIPNMGLPEIRAEKDMPKSWPC
jgi:hypothetical protein